MNIRSIAMYLPQFHPVPENDLWWGKGFTEWTNVAKARPLFQGHYQPHLPADLGFYDLRLPEAREAQAALAKAYGIQGFCYYHYWFSGRRILERPFQEVFESGKPDFPFMLCWANENWTKTWDGNEKHLLLEQHHSEADDIAHIHTLIPYFKDPRYIRVDNKPVFSVYKSAIIPDVKRSIATWRREAAKAGLELYIMRFESFHSSGETLLQDAGFDAAVDFQPFNYQLDRFMDEKNKAYQSLSNRIKSFVYLHIINHLSKKAYQDFHAERWNRLDYDAYVDFVMSQPQPCYKQFPGITPMWDNSARRKKGYLLFKNSTPATYKKWLLHIKKSFVPYSKEENFIFINAWNEWAEGNHLEPCQKWGLDYLQATKEVLEG